jgi:eukaryotic-like serine/threonine-protein kinase
MSGKITGTEPTVAVPVSAPTASGSEPVLSTPAGSSRHTFAGRYEIIGLVGAGGMGTVYRARDAELDEVVALKLLRKEVLDQPGMLDRFRQEVKLARRVTHRNVARTFDIGESEGEKFLTMEFVEGESLAARLARDGALPLATVVEIANALCAGLDAAHGAGIVHRDLKPDNVLLGRDGRIVITDFGIARALSADPARAATVGVALGTPAYMAPEQVEGAQDLDARADLYALGAMLFECLTGERPWTGESIWAVAAARLMHPPPDPRAKVPDLPSSAAQLVMKCMARKRDDRFASAAQVASALASLTLPAARSARASVPPAPQMPLEPDAKGIAVLPFRNLGPAEDAYLAEGVSDDLTDALSMTAGLKVLARGAVARFRGDDRDVRAIGRELGVQVVVEGSVRRAGAMLRVSARVVSVADGFQLWAKRFDRPEKDLLSISDDVADAVAEALTVRRNAPARESPTDGRAVDLYLRARHAFNRGWREDNNLAIGLYEQALALAPNDPTILAGYARAELRRFSFDTEAAGADDAERKARQSAERALSLAPHLGEARAALANLRWLLGDHVGCARDLREAVRITPSSSEINELYGRMLLEAGEPARALQYLTAAASLEPSIDLVQGDLLRARALMGDWSAYEAALEDAGPVTAQSNMRFFLLVRLSMWRRDRSVGATLKNLMKGRELTIQEQLAGMIEILETGQLPTQTMAVIDSWGRIAGRSRRRPMFFRQLAAEVHAYVGERGKTLQAVKDADTFGLIDVTWTDRCPLFEPFRDDPIFAAARDNIAGRAKDVLDLLEGRTP